MRRSNPTAHYPKASASLGSPPHAAHKHRAQHTATQSTRCTAETSAAHKSSSCTGASQRLQPPKLQPRGTAPQHIKTQTHRGRQHTQQAATPSLLPHHKSSRRTGTIQRQQPQTRQPRCAGPRAHTNTITANNDTSNKLQHRAYCKHKHTSSRCTGSLQRLQPQKI